MGVTTTEMLSNQLSNWLSQISNDFDIGFTYRPGNEVSTQEVEVALSTQFFNDRMLVDGNVSNTNNTSNQNTSNIVGDVNVEYKITEKFRLSSFLGTTAGFQLKGSDQCTPSPPPVQVTDKSTACRAEENCKIIITISKDLNHVFIL